MSMKTGNGRSLTMLCANKSVYHAQTHTFTISPEFEEWETKDTKGKEFAPPDMLAEAITGTSVDLSVRLAIPGTTEKEYTTKCVVESFEVSETVSEKATYKASFKGYGLEAVGA